MHALEVRRVPLSLDIEKPGDFAFVPKRKPLVEKESVPLDLPADALKLFWRNFFGKKNYERATEIPLWPERDTIILNCPACNTPFATTDKHKIISVEPLTLDIPLTCPYCKAKSFDIMEGKLMPEFQISLLTISRALLHGRFIGFWRDISMNGAPGSFVACGIVPRRTAISADSSFLQFPEVFRPKPSHHAPTLASLLAHTMIPDPFPQSQLLALLL